MRWETVIEQRHVEVNVYTFEITDLKGNTYTKLIQEEADWYDYKKGPLVWRKFDMEYAFKHREVIMIDEKTFVPRSAVLVIQHKKTEKKSVEILWTHRGLQDWCWLEWLLFGSLWGFILLVTFALGYHYVSK